MPLRRTFPVLVLAAGGLAGAGCAQPQPQQVVVAPPATRQVVAPACDTRFRVVNRSTMTVRNLQFSHSSLSGWGADQLGASMLPPGQAMLFRAANTGNYDFRATWVNGHTAERYGVNVCALRNVIITNSGIAVD
ncbi:hypothetical protein GCM10010964_00450 [Caldovatus sediminis]|uniref:Uncharacterized protein n=1 Tax=Caldovatus sediminis TaxID=2041189 RepID=A0A8J2Z7I0_9PROT|nr:hypothetical protein [Caldovatus sediminis]GGG16033.1 hypothetical protein GCM10010964_00450 [Caldovatus sediminis]